MTTSLSPRDSSVDGVGGYSRRRRRRRSVPRPDAEPTRRRLPEVAAVRRRAGVERARLGARNATSAAVAVSRASSPRTQHQALSVRACTLVSY